MKLEGCSCSGFSYTIKYKNAIIQLYDWIKNYEIDEEYDYVRFQESVTKEVESDASEIRMIIPFLLKAGVINSDNCIKGGERIKKVVVNDNFFTESGKCFIKFLKIEKHVDNLNDECKNLINDIYRRFGIIQFAHLMRSEDDIYHDLFIFLKKYNTIDKVEFFMLTDCRCKGNFDELDKLVRDYRSGKIKETDIEIVKKVNSFQYISKLLVQLKVICVYSHNRYKLGSFFMDYEGDNLDEYR